MVEERESSAPLPAEPDVSGGADPGARARRAGIVVRRPRVELGGIPRYWWGGDPFRTHFLNGFSSTLPLGEAFFVRSVRYYADRVTDPELRAQIRLFAAQEGQHSRLHDQHVDLLLEQGYSALATRNRVVDRILRWHNRRTPAMALAVTAALEHLTAILARQLLRDPQGFTDDMHLEMLRLWRWHALEEAEHKAVAFDVLMQVAPGRLRRCYAMATNSLGIMIEVFDRMAYMLWKDGLLFRGRLWLRGFRFLFGRGGFLRGVWGDYRAWYRKDFHPDEVDDLALIARHAPQVEAEAIG